MSLRTALSRARGLGPAHDGVHHWIAQRLASLANLVLITWFLIGVLPLLAEDRAALIDWFAHPLNAAIAILMFISMFWHTALGLQAVIEDYLHSPWKKFSAMAASKFLCAALGVTAVVSVLKLSFGG